MRVRQPVLVAVLATAMSVQALYATPTRAMAALRAKTCCATRCPMQRVPGSPNRCCQIAPTVNDCAVLSRTRDSFSPPAVVVAVTPTTTSTRQPVAAFGRRFTVPRPRGRPVYLLHRSLRL